MKRASFFVLAVVTMALATFALGGPALAQETRSPVWGGGGGEAFGDDRCGGDVPFLSGFDGHFGAWVDGIRANCHNGSVLPWRGTFGGSYARHMCPFGFVVNGIVPNTGGLFDGAYLLCANLDKLRNGILEETTLAHFGGQGGSPQGFWRCPQGQAVTGVSGGAGTYLDRLGLICAQVN